MFVIWNAMAIPARAIRCGGHPVISRPRRWIRPAVGRIRPVRRLKNVDFPAPLGPMMARISPASTWKSTPLTARRPPNSRVRASVTRIESADAPPSVRRGVAGRYAFLSMLQADG